VKKRLELDGLAGETIYDSNDYNDYHIYLDAILEAYEHGRTTALMLIRLRLNSILIY